MTDLISFARLQAWLSPAFPTGAFSYSHGLEQAIHDGLVKDGDELFSWLSDLLKRGAGWNDAVLLAASYRQSDQEDSISELAGLAEAMALSKERHLETMAQGRAFSEAAKVWGFEKELSRKCPLPVAVGYAAGLHHLDLEMTLIAYLHAYISNQVQAALRLMKLGQQGGVKILADIEPVISQTAAHALTSSIDELGSAAFASDIMAMKHETLPSRIFRS